MENSCVKFVTAVLSCFLINGFVWSQVSDNEAERRLKEAEAMTRVSRNYFANISPSGDYSKLKFIITPNKKIYEQGDKVLIDFSAYNNSSDDININSLSAALFCVYKISLRDSKRKPVPLTSYGKKFKTMQTEVGMPFPRLTSIGAERIPPLESRRLTIEKLPLSLYYDLTRTGEYELTVECLTVIHGQKFDPPLKSNTIKFRIVDYHIPEVNDEVTTRAYLKYYV